MARIKNIELPKEKRIEIGLTYIYGIGRSTATKICSDAKVDPSVRVKDLTPDMEAALRKEVDKYLICFCHLFDIGGMRIVSKCNHHCKG